MVAQSLLEWPLAMRILFVLAAAVATLDAALAAPQPQQQAQPIRSMMPSFASANALASGAGAATASAAATAAVAATPAVPAPWLRRPSLNLAPPQSLINSARNEQIALIKQEIDSTLQHLNELEAKPTDSIEECAVWFNLNERYISLTNRQAPKRASEVEKKNECDKLDRQIMEIRNKLAAFEELVRAENNHLEFVGGLVSSYQEIKQLAAENPSLAKELAALEQGEPRVGLGVERIGQFMQFMDGLLGRAEQRPAAVAAADGEPVALASAAATTTTTSHGLQEDADELRGIDRDLRELIDREGNFGEGDIDQLAYLTGLLDRLLMEGAVDFNSGRFRYLTGTLEAGRAIVMHHMHDKSQEEEEQAEREQEQQAIEEPQVMEVAKPMKVVQLPLPIPFAPPKSFAGASAAAFAHAQNQPQQQQQQQQQLQPPAPVQVVEPPRELNPAPVSPPANIVEQRPIARPSRFKFPRKGNFAAGFASAQNNGNGGAASAAAQAQSNGNGAGQANAAARAQNGFGNSFAGASNGFGSSAAQAAANNAAGQAFAGSQASRDGGYAASAAQANGNSGNAFASSAARAANGGAQSAGGYAASQAQSSGAGSSLAAAQARN